MKLKLIAKNLIGFLLATAIFTTILMLNRSNALQSVELEGRWILTELKANGNEIDVNSTDSKWQSASITFDKKKRYMPDQFTITSQGYDLITGSFTADENGNISFGFKFSSGFLGPLSSFQYENDIIARFDSIIEIFEAINNSTKYSLENDVLTIQDETGENIAKFVRFKEQTKADAVWTEDLF